MVKVKVCGITNSDDAGRAIHYGASALGFIFYNKSPRFISPSKARRLIEGLPPFVTPVGVFVNQGERAIRDICRVTRIGTIQLHGDEEPNFPKRFKDFKIIKAFRLDPFFDFNSVAKYKVDAYLFDTHQKDSFGGTGVTFDWNRLTPYKFEKPVILAGGLNAENVKSAIETVNPYAIDVSSSLELSPGVKDPKLVRAFFEAIPSQGSQVPQP